MIVDSGGNNNIIPLVSGFARQSQAVGTEIPILGYQIQQRRFRLIFRTFRIRHIFVEA